MPPKPTPMRTIGPLHLEDLEPHRFEDLIRQLAYDFREWRVLEPTGRGGSDDGFDARGEERPAADELNDTEGDQDREPNDARVGRLWLFQCKREKSIGPAKLAKYVSDTDVSGLHGLVFAAATDFSKAARDRFRDHVRQAGVAEAYLWGKADIEDMLFQPKNDHLLFAYFGISLLIRSRSIKSEVRAKLAAKRKAERHLQPGQPVLIRDATDDRYPWLDGTDQMGRHDRGRWRVFRFDGFAHDGLRFVSLQQFFVSRIVDGRFEWDRAERMNDALLPEMVDPWGGWQLDPDAGRAEALEIWNGYPPEDRGTLTAKDVLRFEHVVDIDATGDHHFRGPHLYVDREFHPLRGPFSRQRLSYQTSAPSDASSELVFEDRARVQIFPRLPTAPGR